LSLDVTTNTTMDISIVNVNDNIEDDIPVSSSTNSHNIVQCDVLDKFIFNSTLCDVSANNDIRNSVNLHKNSFIIDKSDEFYHNSNNVMNG